MKLTSKLWGNHNGEDVFLYQLKNDTISIGITNFGATITEILTPDGHHEPANIVLAYNTLQEYIDDEFYLGCTVGRFAGRIGGAAVNIDGQNYPLTPNDGDNQLHGGRQGFNKKVFHVIEEQRNSHEASLKLHYFSPHMEEGHPGNVDVSVTYTLTANGIFTIAYAAETDQATHISLTNHCYFNLGHHSKNALSHQLFINAEKCLTNNEQHLPTGEIILVNNTPYDFRQQKPVGEDIAKLGGWGYNQCYLLKEDSQAIASLYHPETGRELTVFTDFPGVVFYSGDYLNLPFHKNDGLCLETQYFPDAPNHTHFPSTLLKPGEKWSHFTAFRFAVR